MKKEREEKEKERNKEDGTGRENERKKKKKENEPGPIGKFFKKNGAFTICKRYIRDITLYVDIYKQIVI